MPQSAPAKQDDDGALDARAKALVNPASGLANDYLNIFNEIIMLVENFPDMPEFGPDILAWRPVSYADYFRASSLPGRVQALEAYVGISTELRRSLEAVVAEIGELAAQAGETVRQCERFPAMGAYVAHSYLELGAGMSACLARATYIVNHGRTIPADDAQERADRLMRRRREDGRRRAGDR